MQRVQIYQMKLLKKKKKEEEVECSLMINGNRDVNFKKVNFKILQIYPKGNDISF